MPFTDSTPNRLPARPLMITGAGRTMTLTGDYSLLPSDGQLINMDAGGSARDVTLPVLSEPTGGLFFIIYNSGGENLVFKNAAASTVITLATLSSCILVSTAPDTWAVVQSSAASATAAEDVGVTDTAGYYTGTDAEAALAEAGINLLDNAIADPGNAGAIAVTRSGTCALTSGGAETRTLAIPTFAGQVLNISMTVDAGDIVVTVAQAFNQAANTTITFNDAGDHIALVGVTVGGALRWRVLASDGVALG